METLGIRVYGSDWTVRPYKQLTERLLIAACQHLTDVIKMTPIHEPAVWVYPENGKGGVGYTVVQPIAESYIALDYWPELDRLYVNVRSCRRYDPYAIARWLVIWLGDILEVSLAQQGRASRPLGLTELEQLKWPT